MAASDNVIETRVPTNADSAGPDRAAGNIAGDSRSREIDGATMSPVGDGAVGVTGGGVLGPTGAASLGMSSKAAPTERLAVIVAVQGPVPEQAPLQPAKLEPGAGVAVSDTDVPSP